MCSSDLCRLDQHDVKADPELRQPPRPHDRVAHGRASHHQARCGENSVAMRDFDSFVDLFGEAKVVSRDDQSLQSAASRRSLRNWKNSTPSRSLRFIICGERTISLTIAAIFGARK